MSETVFAVEADKRLTVGAPSCLAMPNGKLLVAFEVGGADAKGLAGRKGHESGNRWVQSKVYRGAPGGWAQTATLAMRSPRLFRDGGDVYAAGLLDGALQICRSPDGGVSWSEPMGIGGGDGVTLAGVWAVGHRHCALVWEGAAKGWAVWGAPRGAGLGNRKVWARGGSTGPIGGWAAFGQARGAGLPAGGVEASWKRSGALLEAPEGHPWRVGGAGAAEGWGIFATTSGREHWATALRLDAGDLTWHAMGAGPGGEWGWLPFAGGHAPFACAGQFGGGGKLKVAGNEGPGGAMAWGRAAAAEERWTGLAVWESADLAEFGGKRTVVKGGGEGARVVRDPSLAEQGGKTWVAWRQGSEKSRTARDMREIALAEVG